MQLEIKIEKNGNSYEGNLTYENNLIVDDAETLDKLDKLDENFRKLLKHFHGVENKNVNFIHKFI